MKTLAIGLAAITLAAGAARAGEVRVTLTGVQPRGGHILAALQSRSQFMQRDMTSGVALDGASEGEVKFVLADIPAGDYALSVLHDADDSKSMTFGPDGRPAEGWTMPGAAALTGKPAFDEVRVHVPAQGEALVLPMIYPAR